jgi:hypothetical protein
MWTEISTDLLRWRSDRQDLNSGAGVTRLCYVPPIMATSTPPWLHGQGCLIGRTPHNAVGAGRLRDGRSARDQLPRKRRPAMAEENDCDPVLS